MLIFYRLSVFVISLFLCSFLRLTAQIVAPYSPVLSEMEKLESNRDPKCHATAARLEDFIYGTPLSTAARTARIDFQQQLVFAVWSEYSEAIRGSKNDSLVLFKNTIQGYINYSSSNEGIDVRLGNNHRVFISQRDYRQYSSVAYAYRAILSVEQSCIFSNTELAPLNAEMLSVFKSSIDIAVLSLLHDADQLARQEGTYEITASQIAIAAKKWTLTPPPSITTQAISPLAVIAPIIDQKLNAYKAYNEINQAVFLRNIQVYFAKTPWPKNTQEAEQLKNNYTELQVQFAKELLIHAQSLARQHNKQLITYQEVTEAVQVFLPHEINYFEDVTYFHRLPNEDRIVIESYDLDAFRDSGLHWQYLRFALKDLNEDLSFLPDPFALEMLVEGIAQFAVLIFRMAGEDAINTKQSHLSSNNLLAALNTFQSKLDAHQNRRTSPKDSRITWESASYSTAQDDILFVEEQKTLGINFEHRNSDWLSRLIRSYLFKKDEHLARLGIPPAFGGGGVAAEDINNDGWPDILLLGGRGNKLYLNNKGQNFTDITQKAGLFHQREDGSFGEPRQPIIVDFDNDGLQDIFISYVNDNHCLYRNKGNGQFVDVTATAKLGGLGQVAGPVTVIDIDRDGLLDIYIGYFGNYIEGELPTLKRHNTNGGRNRLFRNTGDFIFEDITEGSGVDNTGWTQAVGHSDINGDGWQDLIVGNDFGTNAYYINQHDNTFVDVSHTMGTNKPSYTMNVGIGDINGDLQPDFYISNIVVMEKDDKYVMPNEDTKAHFDIESLATMRVVEANDLFVSTLSDSSLPTYLLSTDVGRGYAATGWSWDADFFDFDNDTDLDLYCLTGMNQYSVYGTDNEYYTTIDGSKKDVQYASSKEEKNILFQNEGGLLNVVTSNSGLDYAGTSRSAAYLDFDKDGDLDIIVNEYQSAARLFRNKSRGNNWVAFRLIDNRRGNNRDAIGAKIILTLPDGRQLWREVHSTTGYLSGHPKDVYFGLGAFTEYSISIIWADGTQQKYRQSKINTSHEIKRD